MFSASIGLAGPGRPEILRVVLDSYDKAVELDPWTHSAHTVSLNTAGGVGEGEGGVHTVRQGTACDGEREGGSGFESCTGRGMRAHLVHAGGLEHCTTFEGQEEAMLFW